MTALRTGKGLDPGEKVLIVLDQFEQWLHGRKREGEPELVKGLRQCDGRRIQAIIMVRDDFWLAVSRFLTELEVRVVEGQNTALVDLFDKLHARKVLTLFGRAYGRLPEEAATLTPEHEAFLDQAVSGLAQEGKVISVRLALFAEMVKGKPWTPDTLKEVGGMEGIGFTFLEETFSAATAPAEHRLHQKAARAVLEALLPEKASEIKGHMRPSRELRERSGYAARPRDFTDLLRILDTELRLVTPTDPEGLQSIDRPAIDADASTWPIAPLGSPEPVDRETYYQLTHDYLVPALREWLTGKQRESWRGRAKLRLNRLEAVWAARPMNRYLPKAWEWANIALFTRWRDWTASHRRMMRQATLYHLVSLSCWTAVLGLLAWGAIDSHGRVRAGGLIRALEAAESPDVPKILDELRPYHRWADTRLRVMEGARDQGNKIPLRARLALVGVDDTYVEPLRQAVLAAPPQELLLIRHALAPYGDRLVEPLWRDAATGPARQRFGALGALAAFDPQGEDWKLAAPFLADRLVTVEPLTLNRWMDACAPVKERLLAPLAAIFRDLARRESERSLAINILAEFAVPHRIDLLAELLLDCDDRQFTALFPRLAERPQEVRFAARKVLETALATQKADADKERLAKRQANAAVALFHLAEADPFWRLLEFTPDPRARSHLLHRLGPLGVPPGALAARLAEEPSVSVRRALLLALGEIGTARLDSTDRDRAAALAERLYRDDPDPGVHAAAEWLLRRWSKTAEARAIDVEFQTGRAVGDRRWYVNRRGQTFAVVTGPVEFAMGSQQSVVGRSDDERPHRRRIDRSFAIASKSVRVREWEVFRADKEFLRRHLHKDSEDNPYFKHFAPEDDCPIHGRTWFELAAYCCWLNRQDGVADDQWCYAPNAEGKFAEGMRLAPDYLRRTGYRLPTEAEWECACRAGAAGSRFYGETAELLDNYGWSNMNARGRTWPVGMLKPNDLGLFDILGNVGNWCMNRYLPYGAPATLGGVLEDEADKVLEIDGKENRIIRGGSFSNLEAGLRCASRVWRQPANRFSNIGFRAARTMP
jgi:formylglycine-generating enzyme required for sulfatase activity